MPRDPSLRRAAALPFLALLVACSPRQEQEQIPAEAATPAVAPATPQPPRVTAPAPPGATSPAAHAPVGPGATSDLQISPAALGAVLDQAIVREDKSDDIIDHDDATDEFRVDSFVCMLVIEQLLAGATDRDAPSFTRVPDGHGYVVRGLKPGSLFHRLGLEDGDVIETLDGLPLDSPGRALLSISDRTRRVELTITRAGQARRLKYALRPGLVMGSRRRHRHSRDDELSASEKLLHRMLENAGDPGELLPSELRTPPVPPTSSRAIPGAEEAVTCEAGAWSCSIEKAFLEKVLANPAMLAKQARVIPSVRDGETRGFKLYGIRPGSLPKLLGFKNGDTVTHVNDEPLDSLNRAMGLYTKLKDANTLRVKVLRKDGTLTLTITFR